MLKVLFFARLREELGCAELSLPFNPPLTLLQLKAQLLAEHPNWQPFFNNSLLMAVNHNMTSADTALKDGDEVAFFPPVTGG